LRQEIAIRERAEVALREADRRKDEFLATLAHELRNPLASIRQAALIFKAPTATEAQKRWSSDVIIRQVQHMSLLLEDLLDISRITRGTLQLRMEMVDLAEIVQAAVEAARHIIDAKRHDFRAELSSEPVHFVADPLRLAQVLSNLLTNAAKYTDPGGKLRLRVSRGTVGNIWWRPPTIAVNPDNGPIYADLLPKSWFDAFHAANRRRPSRCLPRSARSHRRTR
jgi:signal transduction histidine kinase